MLAIVVWMWVATFELRALAVVMGGVWVVSSQADYLRIRCIWSHDPVTAESLWRGESVLP
jgi:hypothetical protein